MLMVLQSVLFDGNPRVAFSLILILILILLFRPGRTGAGSTGRGVLSMSALSHGVIRVDQENSLTSLTLQDCGHILPSGKTHYSFSSFFPSNFSRITLTHT